MIFYAPTLTLLLLQLTTATARTFTVVNECSFTIWPAIYTNLSAGQKVPEFPTGWEAPPYTSAQFTVPDDWKSGRIWGRQNCNFTTSPGVNSCVDGGCTGGLQCDPHTGTGVPPATVAEWTLGGTGNQDFYDVSLVDGFNLPMMIIPSATGCTNASCPNDLNAGCPAQLVGPRNSSGTVIGCKSACVANLDNSSDSSNCCTGSHKTQPTCPYTGVQYYSYFKNNCPNSYVYAYDETSGTALWTCDSTLKSDYRLTFCPPPWGGQSPGPISAVAASLIPSVTFTPTPTPSRSSSSSASASSSPRAKSGTLALLHVSMAPVVLSVLGIMVGLLVLM